MRCAIDQILRNSSNAAKLISGAARLVKRSIDQLLATLSLTRNSAIADKPRDAFRDIEILTFEKPGLEVHEGH